MDIKTKINTKDDSVPVRIILYLSRKSPTTLYRTAKDLKLDKSLVKYHLDKLMAKGVCWRNENNEIEIQRSLLKLEQYKEHLEPLLIAIIEDTDFNKVNGDDPENLLTCLLTYVLMGFTIEVT